MFISIDETSIKDVTSILKSLADGKDRYEINADGYNALFGDPAKKKDKWLWIKYNDGAGLKKITVSEKHSLTLVVAQPKPEIPPQPEAQPEPDTVRYMLFDIISLNVEEGVLDKIDALCKLINKDTPQSWFSVDAVMADHCIDRLTVNVKKGLSGSWESAESRKYNRFYTKLSQIPGFNKAKKITRGILNALKDAAGNLQTTPYDGTSRIVFTLAPSTNSITRK